MADINSLIMEGRVVRNAELTTLKSGMKVAKFSIATNNYKKDKDNNYVENGNFFPLCIFGTFAESIYTYLVKGQKIIVEGFLYQNKWEKDEKKYSTINISVKKIHLEQSVSTKIEQDISDYESEKVYKNNPEESCFDQEIF